MARDIEVKADPCKGFLVVVFFGSLLLFLLTLY